ncbi:unnamed protein product [Ceutorhynchus assimilis]|uniref:Glucose-methanol-choline oxidoreductase N-terminal domain-containing protein n=1 Tax=Ceutorhynchus assimilis TaxID=467358 RepID=A0A9N9QMF3_9CUCU|nr:unnamed protein product [Ceutorhynchus assimilis]
MFPIFTICFLIAISSISFANISNFTELYKDIEELINLTETFHGLENNNEYFVNFDSAKKPIDYGTFDFIIVGAGTAGGVVANRLTETNFKVLLIEAGPRDPDTVSVTALGAYYYNTPLDWGYKTTVQDNFCLATIDKRCIYPRGKMWGGTSSTTGGVYSRGSRWDYDDWANLVGSNDWSYEKVLPYFKKAEKAFFKTGLDASYHGFEGPQGVDLLEDTPGLTKTLLKAFEEKGVPELDYNGKSPYGVGRTQIYLNRNIRTGTAYAYITPASNRTNLVISDNSLVTKVNIVENIAVGVEFIKNGTAYFARASKEVILSAGSINTPQILMLSGIGPSQELKKHGIEVIKNLPVGQNLQDHVGCTAIYFRTNHTYYNLTLKQALELWYENKRPLKAGWGSQILSFINLKNDKFKPPDVEFIGIGPNGASSEIAKLNRYNQNYTAAYKILNQYTDLAFTVILLHPESKGELTLQSNDPRDFPLINLNVFAVEKDLEILYQSIKWLLDIQNTNAFNHFERLHLLMPGCDENFKTDSREWWYCVLRHIASPDYHPISTAIMGRDPSNSVTDPELKVHGIRGLRIVDASVVPITISGHLVAPVVMVADKAADFIKAEYNGLQKN